MKRVDRIELALDYRLLGLFLELEVVDDDDIALMRIGYARGYLDGLTEAQRGALLTELGYKVPERGEEIEL